MGKRRIYLVQPSSQHTNVMPLPYAVSVLHAYVLDNPEIMQHYEFPEYIFEKKEISQVLEKIEDPYAVFFSCYIWNYEYNKALAKEIRRLHPQTKIVFGGHNVPMDYERAFRELPFADYAILGEGERPFEDLLLFFLGEKEENELYNIAYRDPENRVLCRLRGDYVTDRLVSPYQRGLLDGIAEKYKNVYRFSTTLETNRGCPFCCGYCDWGLNKAKLRMAPAEQIRQDIIWISEHGMEECYGADSNYGMFERDLDFVRLFAECKRKNGYPKTFFVSFSKKSDERVLEIASVLNDADMLQGATLSFQSLNPDTLAAIGRKNLDLTYFKNMMRQYNRRRIATYSELILGLPLETEESFKKGIGTLIACGQHSAIDVYECCILPNSDLGQAENIQKYGIVAQCLPFRRFDVSKEEEIQEYSDTVVATSTMDEKSWGRCNLFANTVSALHFGKLFHLIALYLHREFLLPYEDIYMQVLNLWENADGTVWAELTERMKIQLEAISQGKGSWLFEWPEEELHGASFRHAIMKVVLRHFDEYLEQLKFLMGRYCGDQNLVQQLAAYQEFCIETRADRNITESRIFDYDFSTYFEALYLCEDAELQQGKFRVTGDEILHLASCK